MVLKRSSLFFSFLFLSAVAVHADDPNYGISGNPGAINTLTGTGDFGKLLLHIPEKSGVRVGGLWMGDYNFLLNGRDGAHHNRLATGNSLLILDLSINLNKAIGWKGAFFGAEFLQFNGQSTNADAGAVQGYNSLPGPSPLNRSELYQLWIRQEFLDNKLSLRVGKSIPTAHFNNVSKPIPTGDPVISIPSVTGLIYTPIFVNPTLLGAIGGFYNSVYGVVATISPVKQAYVNLGVYDGNLARGVQTGLTGPHFNGYYFSIGEGGYGWGAPKPGIVALGGWYQSGHLQAGDEKENGTGGLYAFGSQALWIKKSETVSKGNISGFFQLGWNNSKTLPMNRSLGFGLTGFALTRPNDSFGVGFSLARLNHYTFIRHYELMLQGYYQAQVYKTVYFQPVLTYIPNPGAHPNKSNVCALTGRLIFLF